MLAAHLSSLARFSTLAVSIELAYIAPSDRAGTPTAAASAGIRPGSLRCTSVSCHIQMIKRNRFPPWHVLKYALADVLSTPVESIAMS